jgi:hypothetical protein
LNGRLAELLLATAFAWYPAVMPQLEITRAALAPEHALATTNYLHSIMLWPGFDHAPQRREFLRTCDAARAIDEAKALPDTLRVEIAEQWFHAKRPKDFEDEVTQRSQEGMLVGEFYAEMIGRHLVGDPILVKDMLTHMASREVRALHPVRNRGRSKHEELIAEYRPAALLLAAAYIRHHFPADLPMDHVAEFLAVSEWVRVRAASIIPSPHRAEALLPPERDLWRVPPYLKLPHMKLPVPEMPVAWWGSLKKLA